MARNDVKNGLLALGMFAVFIGGLVMIGGLGVGESINVVWSPDEVSADTNTTFGGDVSLADRIVVIGAVFSVLGPAGFAVVSRSDLGPGGARAANALPIALAGIGFVEFWDTISDVAGGDYTWTGSMAEQGLALFITGAFIVGMAQLIGLRRN